MKIITCSDEVNEIVQLVTSPQFLELNPVVAGGFIHWLFELAYSKPSRVTETIRSIKATKKTHDLLSLNDTYIGAGKQKFTLLNPFRYGDVDTWFLADNDIWHEGHSLHSLVNVNAYKTEVNAAGTVIGFDKLKHQSQWAHSFERSMIGGGNYDKLQVISKAHGTVAEILDSFDLDLCKIAWYQGKLYLTDEFMQSMKKRKIIINNTHWERAHHFQKVQTAMRAFKYYRRTGFPLSKESVEKVFQLYQDVIDHPLTKQNISKEKTTGPIKIIGNIFSKILPTMNSKAAHVVATYGGFGSQGKSENVLTTQHKRFLDQFICLVLQEEFDDSMLAYFINSGIDNIDELVRVSMDYAAGARPKKRVEPLSATSSLFDGLLDF